VEQLSWEVFHQKAATIHKYKLKALVLSITTGDFLGRPLLRRYMSDTTETCTKGGSCLSEFQRQRKMIFWGYT
jgi:hypothetical protein